MSASTPPTPGSGESAALESYPTFWDAIPVDPESGGGTGPQDAASADTGYSEFINQTEEAPPSRLNVERTDAG